MTGLTASAKRPLLHVREEQASGTDAGTFTSGAWRTRVLNTVKTNEIAGASLGSNQITLPPGDYEIMAFAPARAVDHHHLQLYDTTGTAVLLNGSSEISGSSDAVQNLARVEGRFSLAAVSVLELQHICLTTAATFGLGTGRSDFSVAEVYAEVMIWKVG